MIDSLREAYRSKIGTLRKEIESYSSDAAVWELSEGISNSGGTLCLHLIGNLNHFIGANLGETGYVRERDIEFSDRGVSRSELLERIDRLEAVVEETLGNLTEEDLSKEYPEVLFDKQMQTGMVLAYMSGHLSYHLGQLNYHRRLFDKPE